MLLHHRPLMAAQSAWMHEDLIGNCQFSDVVQEPCYLDQPYPFCRHARFKGQKLSNVSNAFGMVTCPGRLSVNNRGDELGEFFQFIQGKGAPKSCVPVRVLVMTVLKVKPDAWDLRHVFQCFDHFGAEDIAFPAFEIAKEIIDLPKVVKAFVQDDVNTVCDVDDGGDQAEARRVEIVMLQDVLG